MEGSLRDRERQGTGNRKHGAAGHLISKWASITEEYLPMAWKLLHWTADLPLL
jgi:hypothetical protein